VIDDRLTDNDIVISSRISLIRNIADFPFVCTCSVDQLEEIEALVQKRLVGNPDFENVRFGGRAPAILERQLLAELYQLNDRFDAELAPKKQPASIAVGTDSSLLTQGTATIEVNDEDHFQLSVSRTDGDLAAAWESVNDLDDQVEQHFSFAFNDRWGYLTTSPADIGTGMRASVVMHLPGLAAKQQTDKIFRSLQRSNIIGRDAILDPSLEAFLTPEVREICKQPDMFRLTNLTTLGMDETALIQQVQDALPPIINFEREARESVLAEPNSQLERQTQDSVEQLCRLALADQTNQLLTNVLLSRVRFGVSMGLVSPESTHRVLQCFSLAQRRHDLEHAIASENYQDAASIRDQIQTLENQIDGGEHDQ
jgi:protein arginine kinase